MAYSKTIWVDNTTPIDKDNLNKIEQGIYDNSLVVDAVTNTLNPTDTETYKTAELTEGQITDVIGVGDIVIKGDTEQDGTPTPSTPVDVNVVSGSNIVYTSNKNLFNPSNIIANTNIDANGNLFNANNFNLYYISVISGEKYTMTRGQSRQWVYAFSKTVPKTGQQIGTRIVKTSTIETFTVPDGYNYIVVRQIETGGETINNLMILKGTYTTATTYEEHQGKELTLDLPVENLFDGELELGTFDENGTPISTTNSVRTKNYIQVKPNTTYTISNNFNYQSVVQAYNSSKTFIQPLGNISTFTTDSNTYYIKWRSSINLNENNLNVKFQLEQGSKANAYTPYGTTPIELCKIGYYQDYFYKSGSKWYLHKGIGKDVIDENSTISIINTGTSNWFYQIVPNPRITTKLQTNQLCNYYVNGQIALGNTENGILKITNGEIRIRYGTEDTVANFKTWLALNNVKLYYILETATDTEIIDTTLISQLEAIYNAPLYEQTNITQENNDLPMILDITACKDNINGIKAFIRK